MEEMFLADTQVVIWSLISPAKIVPIVRSILQTSTIFVSEISLFEIAIKQKINRLPDLTLSVEELTSQLISDGFRLLPIEQKHIFAYSQIPLYDDHRDPFDRLLLATALAEGLTVISSDENFTYYTNQIRLFEA
jgi:PIN domain nuclease of toxin-antitoxin system